MGTRYVFHASLMDSGIRRVVSVDYRVQGITGYIHSIYHNVVNVLIEINNQTELLSVATKKAVQAPHMITIDEMVDFLDNRFNLINGKKIRITGYKWLLNDYVELDLKKALNWNRDLNSIPPIMPNQTYHGFDVIQPYMRSYGQAGGFKYPWLDLIEQTGDYSKTIHEKALFKHLLVLHGAMLKQQIGGIIHSIKPLIGLGPGLTPSGDDFITGYVFTLQALARPLAKEIIGQKGDILFFARKRTTVVSYHMLRHALEGRVNEALIDLLVSISHSADHKQIKKQVGRLFSIGASSGTDMLAGVLFALLHSYKVEVNGD